MSSPLALPFDQYQRYRLVADLLAAVRPAGERLRVLDVGGRTALLRRFLDDDVTLVDVEASGEEGLVLGDGARLPFRDRSFDVVTAFDTLEHVPPPQREAFVAECRRVARRHVVLAGPYEAPRVVAAERLLQRFLREKLRTEHRYLEEHRHNGLPGRAAVEAQLRALGGRTAAIGHGNIDRWLALMCLSLYMDDDPGLRPLAEAVHTFYNRSLYASDHAEPVYRHAIVAAFGGAPLPRPEAVLPAAPVAPRGALERFHDLEAELLAFDRERGAWRTERDRLRKVIEDLRGDLQGHQGTLAELREELDASRRHGEALQATLADEREQAAGVRAELQALADANLAVARKVEADLHRVEAEAQRMQADLLSANRSAEELHRAHSGCEQEMAALRAEADAQRVEAERARSAAKRMGADLRALADKNLAAARRLEAELRRVEGEARQIQADLLAANSAAGALNAVVLKREAELSALRGELHASEVLTVRLHADVERLSLEKAGLREHLDALQREAAALRGDREQLLVQVRALQETLRRRWHNLKRVLDPRPPSGPA